MISKIILLTASLLTLTTDWQTPFEKSKGLETATYQEAVDWYARLDQAFPGVQLLEYGKTDIGKPLHLVVVSADGLTDPAEARRQNKRILFINNAIHAGEPCGVDASMMLVRDLMQDEKKKRLLDKVVLVLIPVYNIGGHLNRGSFSRANQEGPVEHGFRGNARNYDLNRDFIKADTRNARSFIEIFQTWMPDVFVDTHTTNGADYQAVLTLIPTQPDKLDPEVVKYMDKVMIPELELGMAAANQKMCPYVYSRETPDEGIAAFLDLPRYSSGYAALFQTMSFITEAHMLKPYAQRVEATYTFLQEMLVHVASHAEEIRATVQAARDRARQQQTFALAWELDRERSTPLAFEGYEAKYKPSEVSGQERLYYDRNAPYTKEIPWFRYYKTTAQVDKPVAYIVPQGQEATIERLTLNHIEMKTLREDMKIVVEVSYIENLRSSARSYEGHFQHQTFSLRKEMQEIQCYAGDKVVFTDQWRNPYLVHVLEPEAADAFFRWNFYDGILMQKEYFSSYVFEETALQLLADDPALKIAFEAKKAADPDFAGDGRAQLNFLYEQSEYYEKATLRRYPIFHWAGGTTLPLH